MNRLNTIGLEPSKAEDLAQDLNQLLADYQIYYQNLRGFHWNVKGEQFFELHEKFEELYNDALVKIDEIAERVLTLGATPLHSFSAYIEKADIQEARGVEQGKACVEVVLNNLGALVRLERQILDKSGEANDEGTNALMSDYIREQEKLVWMLSAYLS